MVRSSIARLLRRIPWIRRLALARLRPLRAKRAADNFSYHQSVMGLIGTMTVSWAGIERILDELIAHHQQQFTDLSQEHPRALSNKLKYLKRMERDRLYTWGARDFFRKTRLEAARLGNERHAIIHGVMRRTGSSVIWHSQRVLYDGPGARIHIRDFHNDELVQILKDIQALLAHISPRVWLLIGNDPGKAPGRNIEEPLRELQRATPPVHIP